MTQNFCEAQPFFWAPRHFHICTHFRNSILISWILLPRILFCSVNLWQVPVKYNSCSVDDPGHFLTCDYPYVMTSFQETLTHNQRASFWCREAFTVHRGCCRIFSTPIALTPGLRPNYAHQLWPVCLAVQLQGELVLCSLKGNLAGFSQRRSRSPLFRLGNARASFFYHSFLGSGGSGYTAAKRNKIWCSGTCLLTLGKKALFPFIPSNTTCSQWSFSFPISITEMENLFTCLSSY